LFALFKRIIDISVYLVHCIIQRQVLTCHRDKV
jgi:hypothetical protein